MKTAANAVLSRLDPFMTLHLAPCRPPGLDRRIIARQTGRPGGLTQTKRSVRNPGKFVAAFCNAQELG